jgi:hypothetical protein
MNLYGPMLQTSSVVDIGKPTRRRAEVVAQWARAGHRLSYGLRRLRTHGDPDANSVGTGRRTGIPPRSGLTPILHFNSEGHVCCPRSCSLAETADAGEAGQVRRCVRRERSGTSVAGITELTRQETREVTIDAVAIAWSRVATTHEAVEARCVERSYAGRLPHIRPVPLNVIE